MKYPPECPGCGCPPKMHNAVAHVPMAIGADALVPHCKMCGACWDAADHRFVKEVLKVLKVDT